MALLRLQASLPSNFPQTAQPGRPFKGLPSSCLEEYFPLQLCFTRVAFLTSFLYNIEHITWAKGEYYCLLYRKRLRSPAEATYVVAFFCFIGI